MRLISLALALVLVVAIGLALAPERARSAPPASLPVIVVFRDDVSFEPGRGFFHADDRAQANPEAWAYLDRGVAGTVQALEVSHGFRATHIFTHAIRGFSASLTARQIQALEQDPTVAYVEPDGTMRTQAQTLPWGINRIEADVSSTIAGNGGGAVGNVHAYVIDTGIDVRHADLAVVRHVNFASGQNTDCNGHGTHVAGTIAAKDNTSDVVGAAPGAPLTGVKVLGCSGSGYTSWVIKGVDWVTANALRPAVANMSLGGGLSTALDDAVKRSAASRVFYAIAAGNSGGDACQSSPARAARGTTGIMAAGATDSANRDASWSNTGPCVDVWAPGVSILSTRRNGGTTTMSGTSMAAPHVAGTAALYLSSHPAAASETVESALKADATATGTTANDGAPITLVNAAGY